MNIVERLSNDKSKIYYTLEWGRGAGQRSATGIFTYVKPKNQVEKNHNKQALLLLETKKSQLIIEQQCIGTGIVPAHKMKANFLDYYSEYVLNNKRDGNRHLPGSFEHFKAFLKKDFIAPIDITENLCSRFRQYLLDKFNGDTPANYFSRYKRVLKAATKEGYFRLNPADDVKAKSNPSTHLKENLEADEYIRLLKTPCLNEEVKEAFVLSCYTGLRWCDVKPLSWSDIKGDQLKTRLIQAKTGEPVWVTLHPIAKAILEKRKAHFVNRAKNDLVFQLPTHDGANKLLQAWCNSARLDKHITWHCARLSFSILLQDAHVDDATVACLLGHRSTKHVRETYKRHRPKDLTETIARLPSFDIASMN